MLDSDDKGQHSIRWGKNKINITTMALMLMLASILFPAAFNALHMQSSPSPTQLLITICVSLFASVIYLWILDATNVLRFRNEWVSKSIYGAAIVSVLGTSVGVYKDYFQSDKYPYRGIWDLTLTSPNHKLIAENELNLSYSVNSDSYFGYSNLNETALHDTTKKILSVSVKSFSIENKSISLICYYRNGDKIMYNQNLEMTLKTSQVIIKLDSLTTLDLVRPN